MQYVQHNTLMYIWRHGSNYRLATCGWPNNWTNDPCLNHFLSQWMGWVIEEGHHEFYTAYIGNERKKRKGMASVFLS